jgi:transcriptional regulator with XRE-family HTH domain
MERTPIVRLMDRYGLEPGEIQAIAGVSRQSVWNWKTGKTRPDLKRMEAIVRGLRRRRIFIGIDDFVGRAA